MMCKRLHLFAVIFFIGSAHGLLVVGPKFFRTNQSYTLVVSNFQQDLSSAHLMMKLEGQSNTGESVLNLTKMVEVRKTVNQMIEFNMPKDLSRGSYKLRMEGQHGFNFHKEVELVFLSKTISGLIQINQPVFKSGDTVKFRVIVLDSELKPPANVKFVHVTIRDPQQNVIQEWEPAQLYAGVFESEVQISATPMFGLWSISVLVEGDELVSKMFTVKEYVLSTFDVEVTPTVIPLEEHQALNLTIAAYYHFGKPVQGLVKLELYLEDDTLDQRKELEVYGMGLVDLQFAGFLELVDDEKDVRVKVSFVEKLTNQTVVRNKKITVFKYPYRVELVKEYPQFRPGHIYECALQFSYHDGTPAVGITGKVEINEMGYEESLKSDSNGLIELQIQPDKNIDGLDISFSNEEGRIFFYERVDKIGTDTIPFIDIKLKSPVILNNHLWLHVTCTERMPFFVYYVMSKSNIIDTGIMRPNRIGKYQFQLNATELMLPSAKVIVATVANNMFVYDYVDIDFQRYRNNFDLSIDEHEIEPGRKIELSISGPPGAYVRLAAYDKGLLMFSKNHDLFWEDIKRVFDGFHDIVENEFDMIGSMGLFVRTFDDSMLGAADYKSLRRGWQSNSGLKKIIPYRSSFVESWLWKNVTIGMSGRRILIETVPDAVSSWFLTGFSIHPEYGLSLIKKPIELKTIRMFYVIDNLPYSIKLGEAVSLQFILFSYLKDEYIADITLNNEDNQLEFIGRPPQDKSYTKSMSIPPKKGVPVSFLVKAHKLGEMVVSVKASAMLGIETDALKKIIQVIP